MSFYLDVRFFIYLAMFLISMFIVNYFELKNKRIILLSLSTFFLLSVLGPIDGLALPLVYLCYEYFIINVAFSFRRNYGRNYKLYPLMVFLSLLPLLLLKFKAVTEINFVHILGLSYMSFKNIDIISENRKGLLKEVLPFDYLSFMIFFPTFMAGPLDKVRRFLPDSITTMDRAMYLDLCGRGIYRFITGVFFKFVISDFFLNLLNNTYNAGILETAIMTTFYIYFEISGYANMVIGASYISGVKCPENFNKALLSTSFIEFWDNYLISIVSWFKEHVFRNIRKVISLFLNDLDAFVINSISIVLTFIVFGLWHGFELRYLIFALYNAFFYIINYYIKYKTTYFDEVKDSPIYTISSYIVTFVLLSFSFLIFSGRLF